MYIYTHTYMATVGNRNRLFIKTVYMYACMITFMYWRIDITSILHTHARIHTCIYTYAHLPRDCGTICTRINIYSTCTHTYTCIWEPKAWFFARASWELAVIIPLKITAEKTSNLNGGFCWDVLGRLKTLEYVVRRLLHWWSCLGRWRDCNLTSRVQEVQAAAFLLEKYTCTGVSMCVCLGCNVPQKKWWFVYVYAYTQYMCVCTRSLCCMWARACTYACMVMIVCNNKNGLLQQAHGY